MTTFSTIEAFNQYLQVEPPRHQLIDVGQYTPQTRLASPPVYPQFYRISLKYGLETGTDAGYMYFSSPGKPLEWATDKPWRGYYIQIAEALISHNQHLAYSFLDYGMHEALNLTANEATTISGLFHASLQAYQQQPLSLDLLMAHCNLMFAHIAQFYNRQFGERKQQYSQLVNNFFNLLQGYYSQQGNGQGGNQQVVQPSVAYFANALHVTPNYLSDVVKFYTQKPALEHIHLHIVAQAKARLAHTQMPITQIAYDLGFEYPNYFSRLFRKVTGKSPSAYRNL